MNERDTAPDAEAVRVPGSAETAEETQGTADEVAAWLSLGAGAGTVLQQFLLLLRLEARLAVGDAGRLVAVLALMLPLALLAWVGLSVLLAWLVFSGSGSVALGITGFLAVQVVAMLLLALAARRFQRSLSFPATRRQWEALFEKTQDRATDGEAEA
jgi:hypothetical protein